MSGEYGPDYFTVKNRAGKDVAAKLLNDEYGNYIINPKTNKPYMVPANFDLKTFIDRYSLLSIMEDPIGGLVGPIPEVYITFFVNFMRGGQNDFQRSYNGYMGSMLKDDDFVKEFTPFASLALGMACKAAGLSEGNCLESGGVYNRLTSWLRVKTGNDPLNTSGAYGNNPDNAFHISNGYNMSFAPVPSTAISVPANVPSGRQFTEVLTADIAQAKDDKVYIVKPGNILGDIARKFGTTEEELIRLNPDIKDKNKIYVGQKIILPNADNANVVNPNLSSFQFNADGNITSYTDSDGKVTTYNYDASGNLTKATGPDGRITTYQRQYNEQNLCTRLTVTEPTGEVTVYQYDAGGMVATITGPTGTVTNYYRDEQGNIYSMSVMDSAGALTTYQYNAGSNSISETCPDGDVLTTTYNASGNIVSSSYTDSLGSDTTTYAYDANGNMTSSTETNKDANGIVTGITSFKHAYDGSNNLVSSTETTTTANGAVTGITASTFSYDSSDRMISYIRTDKDSSGTVISTIAQTYIYDSSGNPISIKETITDSAGTEVNTYNAGWKLTSQLKFDLNNQLIYSLQNEYDANGNITNVMENNYNNNHINNAAPTTDFFDIPNYEPPPEPPHYEPGLYSGDVVDTPIGAFYVAGNLSYDDSESNAAMTGTVVLNDPSQPAHRFTDLRTLDSNGDGKLDTNDQRYSSLTIWHDLNENGITDAGETKTLTDAGISSIDLAIPNQSLATGLLVNPISQASIKPSDPGNPVPPPSPARYSPETIPSPSKQAETAFSVPAKVQPTTMDYSYFRNILNTLGGNPNTPYWYDFGSYGRGLIGTNNPDNIGIGSEGSQFVLGGPGDDNLYGNDSDNRIFGGTDNDLIVGLGGSDYLNGESGNDTVYAGQDSDAIFGESGADFLSGGDGNDYIDGGDDSDTIFGGQGNDDIYGNEGDDILIGEDGADRLFGQAGNDIIVGGAGDDIIVGFNPTDQDQNPVAGQTDDDRLFGGDGNDYILGQWGSDYIEGGIGDDTVYAGQDNDTIFGESGADYLMGEDGNDYIDGETDNDLLMGGAGDDTLFGGTGDDELQGNEGDDILIGEDGADRLFGQVGNDIIIGGAGDDIIVGFNPTDQDQNPVAGRTDDDRLFGGDGNDYILGQWGNDYIEGGIGNDTVYAGQDNDAIFGESGADFLSGEDGNDLMIAGAGNDAVAGGTDNDELQGGSGSDILYGEAGNDKMFGQAGDDTLYGGDGDDRMFGFKGDNEDQGLDGETDSDLLMGGAGNDLMLGGAGNDTIYGEDGDDQIGGGTGNDYIAGGIGADILIGEAGNDTIFGAEGNDQITGGTGDDYLAGGTGDDLLIGETGNNTIAGGDGADELQGGSGSDILYGEAGNDKMFGQAGDDVIYGGDGDDIILGFMGSNETQDLPSGRTDNDRFYGGSGSDRIWGGAGSDYIDGGAGADWMMGGAGDDTYVVNTLNDLVFEKPDEGNDTVLSSATYLLNSEIETLILLGDDNIHGAGNRQDNIIVGNSGNNILDGVTGADTMIGGAGNDVYYVDNTGDAVIEKENEGTDTIQSSISLTLSDNIENLSLISCKIPERGVIDAEEVFVYGYPKRNELDYMQGDNSRNFLGTCALTSIANLLIRAGYDKATEDGVVQRAIDTDSCVHDNFDPSVNGASTAQQQMALLASYGLSTSINAGSDLSSIACELEKAHGVLIGVNAGMFWNDPGYYFDGSINHLITLTGVVYNTDGSVKGFFVCDSGRQLVTDMTRYVSCKFLAAAAHMDGAYALITTSPIKEWDANINGTGNALDNQITGTEGMNILDGRTGNDRLLGGGGADTLIGGEGNDLLDGGSGVDSMTGGIGNDVYYVDNAGDSVVENADEGVDAVYSSVSYSLGADTENLMLIGADPADATGNALDNIIFGNEGANRLTGMEGADIMMGGAGDDTLDGGAGADVIYGGTGNDTYLFALNGGSDIINDAGLDEATDCISFSDTIAKETIAFFQNDTTLRIAYGDADSITVLNQNNMGIEKIQLSDGMFLTDSDINLIIQQMTAFAADKGIAINNVNDVKSNQELMGMIVSAWHG